MHGAYSHTVTSRNAKISKRSRGKGWAQPPSAVVDNSDQPNLPITLTFDLDMSLGRGFGSVSNPRETSMVEDEIDDIHRIDSRKKSGGICAPG